MKTRLRYLYRAYRYRYRVDPAEIQFVCHCLARGQVAVDVGCHKGAYAYWMRRRVGPSGAVFAFEPQPGQIAYLREVFSALRYDNVSIVPMAVSNSVGKMELFVPQGKGLTHAASLEAGAWGRVGGNRHSIDEAVPRGVGATAAASDSIDVDVTTLDAFFGEQSRTPHLIKIDVEGHELAVLEGAQRTLGEYRPTLLIECEARHRPDGDVRPVFEFLASLGYEGSFFEGRKRRPIAEFDPRIHQQVEPGSNDLPDGYVNNFAFVHRSTPR